MVGKPHDLWHMPQKGPYGIFNAPPHVRSVALPAELHRPTHQHVGLENLLVAQLGPDGVTDASLAMATSQRLREAGARSAEVNVPQEAGANPFPQHRHCSSGKQIQFQQAMFPINAWQRVSTAASPHTRRQVSFATENLKEVGLVSVIHDGHLFGDLQLLEVLRLYLLPGVVAWPF